MVAGEGFEQGVAAARKLAALDCCRIGPGLTGEEFSRIEERYGFEFADDHRGFLATGLPVNRPRQAEPGVVYAWDTPWPNWREPDPELEIQVYKPYRAVLDSPWWPRAWGPRPDDPRVAAERQRRIADSAPTLIPVYGHRYLPAGRGTFGSAVLSLWGLDIIYYGGDLVDYLGREFGGVAELGHIGPTPGFWLDVIDDA